MIFLASDHAGYELKKNIAAFLDDINLEYEDIGPHKYAETDDYPDYIFPAAEKVALDPDNNKGIFMGGSGQGEAIVANKVKRVRAGVYYGGPREIVILHRTHNKANVLSLGARFMSYDEAREAVRLWLDTEFNNDERHARRIRKIIEWEKKQ